VTGTGQKGEKNRGKVGKKRNIKTSKEMKTFIAISILMGGYNYTTRNQTSKEKETENQLAERGRKGDDLKRIAIQSWTEPENSYRL